MTRSFAVAVVASTGVAEVGACACTEECGPAPWYVGCYKGGGDEHFVGVNGDTKAEALRLWREEVAEAQGIGSVYVEPD